MMIAIAEDPASPLEHPISWVARRRRWLAGALWVVVVAVYAAAISPHWWVGRDAALYLALGRNLARGQGYTIAGQAHTLVPPGYPAMLALLMRAGAGSFLALNVVMAAVGLTTAWVGYLLLCRLVHRDWALLLAVVFGLSNELLQRSGEILTDVPFTLVILTAFWLYARGLDGARPDRRGWEVASVLLVGGCWIRMASFPLVAGAAVGLLLSAWRTARRRALVNVAIVFLGCAATAGAFCWYASANADPRAASYIGGMRHYLRSLSLGQRLAMPFQRLYDGSRDLSRLVVIEELPGPLCLLLLSAPIVVAMVRRVRRGDWIGPLAVVCYVGAMAAAAVKIRTRYLLCVAPLLMLYLVEGYVWTSGRIWQGRTELPRVLAGALMFVMLCFNLVKVGRNIVEKHSADYEVAQQGGKWRELPATVEYLRRHRVAGKSVLGEHAYGYLADMPSPVIPRRLLSSRPDDERMGRLLADWNVAFVVINTRREMRPFRSALWRYARRAGSAAFRYGDVLVYAVGSAEPTTAETAPGKGLSGRARATAQEQRR